jgi:hypothetical protein
MVSLERKQALSASRASEADGNPSDEIVWGAAAIGRVINRSPRQAVYLLEKGELPAKKIGGRWCGSRAKLISGVAG